MNEKPKKKLRLSIYASNISNTSERVTKVVCYPSSLSVGEAKSENRYIYIVALRVAHLYYTSPSDKRQFNLKSFHFCLRSGDGELILTTISFLATFIP